MRDVGGDLRRQVGQQVGDRAADVLLGRQAVDLGQPVVDAHVAQVDAQQREADRRALEDDVEQRHGGLQAGSQHRDPDGDGGAEDDGRQADDVLPGDHLGLREQDRRTQHAGHDRDGGGGARGPGQGGEQRPEDVQRDDDRAVAGQRVRGGEAGDEQRGEEGDPRSVQGPCLSRAPRGGEAEDSGLTVRRV